MILVTDFDFILHYIINNEAIFTGINMELKQQVANEINNQILHLMISKSIDVSVRKDSYDFEKIKILAEMEVLEEGFLIINKK